MIKAIVFDCFGVVLADTLRPRIADMWQKDPAAGQMLSDINRASNRGMITREESAQKMAEILGVDYKEILRSSDLGEVKNQELIDFIKTLRPKYKLAMLSNVLSRDRLDVRFDPGELDDLFDEVIASGDEGYIKPEPRIYEIALERLGVESSESVMIDDVDVFCRGAEAVGMHAIQYESNQKLFADLGELLDK